MRFLPLLLIAVAATAFAEEKPVYNADTLIWKCESIVQTQSIGDRVVRVIKVLHGTGAVGKTLLLDKIYPYEDGGSQVLFLTGEGKPVLSGVWIVERDRVCGLNWFFTEYSTTGGQEIKFEDFGKVLFARVQAVDALKRMLAKPAQAADAPVLVKTLIDRSAEYPEIGSEVDLLGQEFARRLVGLGDPKALVQTLARMTYRTMTWPLHRILAGGLANPAGREALVAGLSDTKASAKSRLRLADALGAAGPADKTRVGKDWKPADKPNARYLTRLAELAYAARKETPLCIELCGAIGHLHRYYGAKKSDDAMGTVPPLEKLFREQGSGVIGWNIATLFRSLGPETYAKLKMPVGPILGIKIWGANRGEIECTYEFSESDVGATGVLVFKGNGGEWSTPIPEKLGDFFSGGRFKVPFPKDLKPGRYKVYVRYKLKNGAQRVSYGFEAGFDEGQLRRG